MVSCSFPANRANTRTPGQYRYPACACCLRTIAGQWLLPHAIAKRFAVSEVPHFQVRQSSVNGNPRFIVPQSVPPLLEGSFIVGISVKANLIHNILSLSPPLAMCSCLQANGCRTPLSIGCFLDDFLKDTRQSNLFNSRSKVL